MPHLSKEELWDGVFNVTSFHVGILSREDGEEVVGEEVESVGRDLCGGAVPGGLFGGGAG
jgi:hypothetical protein